MNTLLLRTLELKKTPSLQTFAQYREAESQNCRHSSVTSEGELLEHQTLELRVHPPNVSADQAAADARSQEGEQGQQPAACSGDTASGVAAAVPTVPRLGLPALRLRQPQ